MSDYINLICAMQKLQESFNNNIRPTCLQGRRHVVITRNHSSVPDGSGLKSKIKRYEHTTLENLIH